MRGSYILFRLIYKFLFFLFPFTKPFFLSLRERYYIYQQHKVADYLHKNYICNDLEYFQLIPKDKKLVGKKIIWQYWGQGVEKSPDMAKVCFKSVEKNKGDYKVIILDNETIKNYIDLPEFVYNKLKNGNFCYQHFSDLLRVSLLSTYGGVWCDATIYLSDKIPPILLNKDFFVFQRGSKPVDYKAWSSLYFSWHPDFKVNVLNSFIITKPNNPIIQELNQILLNWWKNEYNIKHYFLFQILFNEIISKHKNCEIICDTIPHMMDRFINKKYSDELWQKITKNNSIHKLTYYEKIYPNTILSHILGK